MALIIALSPPSEVINLVWKVVSERNIFTSLWHSTKGEDTEQKEQVPYSVVFLISNNICKYRNTNTQIHKYSWGENSTKGEDTEQKEQVP